MELYIVRHGKTYWNNEKKIQGWADIELTESGRQVAYDSAEGMKDIHFDAIYSSPLKRAYETACILKGTRELPIVVDERIKEIGFGVLEGADSVSYTHLDVYKRQSGRCKRCDGVHGQLYGNC